MTVVISSRRFGERRSGDERRWMMKGCYRTGAVLLASACALVGAGCSSSSSASSPTTTTVPTESKGFEVETLQGQTSLSLDGKLPPHWPAKFPVAPHAKRAGSGSRGGASRTVLVGVYTSTDTPEHTYSFYRSTKAFTVERASSLGTGSAFAGTAAFSGRYSGSVTVLSHDESTYVVVELETAGTGTTTTTAPAPS
jgi:hypothetical protein